MATLPNETLRTHERITYRNLIKAIENVAKFYQNPNTPIRMAQRTFEIGYKISEVLSNERINIYSNGYPFSGGYNLLFNGGKTPLVGEIVRFTEQQKYELEKQNKDELPYHCLEEGDIKEELMLQPNGQGIDFSEQIYNCQNCHPTLQQLFYPFPDLDIYIIMDDFPSVKILERIQEEGRNMGLYPKYINLRGIIDFYSLRYGSNHNPPLSIDYFFVRKGDLKKRLNFFSKGDDWINLKIPCKMIRYGTQTFRESFLEFGKNLVLDLQPIKQKDMETKTELESTLKQFLEENDSDSILKHFIATSKSSSRELYKDPVIQNAIKLRHNLIKNHGLIDIL